MPVVISISDRTKAFIEPGRTGNDRRWTGVLLLDQVACKRVDIDSVGDVANRVSVADDVVRVRSVVTHAGRKVASKLAFQGDGPDIGLRRLQERIHAANGEAGADNSSLRVKPAP